MSRVDVVIPCYNYGRYLRGCVESVLDQQGVDVKVLVIDDASPDHTAEVGTALAARDGRVTFRRHVENRGHIETYNEGMVWAGGDYILLLSADDQLTPGALSRAAHLMDAHPEIGFTYGKAIKTNDPDAEVCPIPRDYNQVILSGPEFLERCCAENIVPTPTAVVRTSLQKRLGGYRKELPHSGDMEMWLRFAANASVGKIDADQAYYRMHDTNMYKNYGQYNDVVQRKAAFDTMFEAYGHRIEGGERLQRLASRRLAEDAFWMGSHAFDRGKERDCRRLIALALELDPSLKRWPAWHRLRLKRMMGVSMWSRLRPLARRRRRHPQPVAD